MKIKKFFKFLFLFILIFLILSPVIIPASSGRHIAQEKYIANFQIEGGSFLEVDGYKTYYIDINPEAEETVLLIHGFGGSATNWTSVMYELADEGFRVVAVDLKGFGLSEKKVDDDFSHKSQAKFLNSFVEKLDLENITVVGHSMGGNIATMYVLEYPERIEKLVLVSAAVLQGEDFDRMRSDVFKVLDLPVFREYVRVGLKFIFSSKRIESLFNSAMYQPEKVDVQEPQFVNPTLFFGWEYIVIKMTSALHMNLVEKPLSEINVPVYILWGEKDIWTPVSQGKNLNSKIEGSKFELMEDVGHLPMFENPDVLLSKLKKALQSL